MTPVLASSGVLAWLLLGLAVLLGFVALGVRYLRRHRGPELSEALPAAADAGRDGKLRILVVADESCAAADLGDAIADGALGRGETEVLVVCPALSSRVARWTGDEAAYARASEHLDATLAALSALGVPARGHVGSHDPLQAADEGLRELAADELVFVTPAEGEQNWLESGVVETAHDRYGIPVRQVAVPRTTAPADG
jgi:hypothetical protein